MRWLKKIRVDQDGLSIAADINAAIAVNQGRAGMTSKVESASHVRVVQGSRSAAKQPSGGDRPETEQEDAND